MIRFLLVTACLILGLSFQASTIHAQPTEKRVDWTACRIVGSPEPPQPFAVERVFEDIKLQNPTEMIRLPGTDRWVVVQMNGTIFTFSSSTDRDVHQSIDLKAELENFFRAYGIAFHPDFPKTPECYVTFSATKKDVQGSRLSRFKVTDVEKLTIDPASEEVLVRWSSIDHCGGSPKFGPDGMLYFSIGDGNRPNPPDPPGTGQDISDLQASILRIDVDKRENGLPYAIPSDNPFVNLTEARGEVWAFGVRNPWRIGFHRHRGDLWVGDVGWEMMEMVYKIERGANYGWSVMEGSQQVKPNGVRHEIPITPPVVEYDHTEGRSITGGYFWTSDQFEELKDTYIYGDYQSGKIWGLNHDGTQTNWHKLLVNTRIRIICFAEEDDGEILIVGFEGTIHRFKRNPAASVKSTKNTFPTRLSETGLFQSVVEQTPEEGVIAYSINAKHWSDHTTSEQWFGIPGDGKMGINARGNFDNGTMKGFFNYPEGMVFAKTVSYLTDVEDPTSSRRLETQVLHKLDQDWRAYNYLWNEEQTDAILQPNEAQFSELVVKDPNAPNGLRKQQWLHASRDQCMLCHIWRGGSINGFKVDQLNRTHIGEEINQLDKLESMDYVNLKLPRPNPAVSPLDETATLNDRARRYLDLNCAHCHMRGGGGSSQFVLLNSASNDELEILEAEAMQGDFGMKHPKIVAPGDPSHSTLLYRIAKSGPGKMPKFGPNVVDQAGAKLIKDWIASLKPEVNSDSNEINHLFDLDPNSKELDSRLDQLLASTETALLLSIQCGEPDTDRDVRKKIVERSKQSDAHIRDLFERFLPEDERTKRLEPNADLATLVNMQGNVERGKKLFFESSLTCRNCHQINGKGKMVGPDLSNIGNQRKPEEILKSIAAPSDKIEEQYRGYLVVTFEGLIVTGFKIEETEDSFTIVDSQSNKHVIKEDDVDEMRPLDKSIMPEQLLESFTAQQAADLLAFLSSLKVNNEMR